MDGTDIKNEVFEVCYHIQKSSKTLVVVDIVLYIDLNESVVGIFVYR